MVLAAMLLGPSALVWQSADAAPKKKTGVTNKSEAQARKEAAMASHVAHAALSRGEFAKASNFYKEAWKLDSSVLGYLFSSARAAHRGGDLDTAEQDYSDFLERNKNKKSPLVEKTKGYLLEVRKARELKIKEKLAKTQAEMAAMKARQKAAAAPPAAVKAPARGGVPTAAWVALGGGALLAIAGGSMYAIASSQRADLDAKLDQKNAKGKITGITQADAKVERESIETGKTVAAAMGGASVLALGVGAWLWWSAPDAHVAFSPAADGRGLLVSVRF
jgi:tetratricopeptide (TPR) repeat protein